jgi:hypothetical protein
VDQRLVREHVLDHRSHEACARALCLIPVADAQGLRLYADHSLCQRLSMTREGLPQARQTLIHLGLVASQHPRSQVFALDTDPIESTQSASTGAADAEPGAIKAGGARIWEGLS